MTDCTDFFEMILAFAISFIASYSLSFLPSIRQTLPNPPLPIAYSILKLAFEIYCFSVLSPFVQFAPILLF